jgi:hypothetical protein
VYAFLKLNAPANDLVKGQGIKTLGYLFDMSRHKMVAHYFYLQLSGPALAVSIVALFYSLYCIAARCGPGRNVLIIVTCAAGYWLVYIVTPHDLAWHLSFSLDRVLFQLVPAFVYILGRNFCNIHLFVDKEQFQ